MKNGPEPGDGFLRTIIDAIPSFVFVADHETRVILANRAATRAFPPPKGDVVPRLCGEFLRCINALGGAGCGTSERCSECNVRKTILNAFTGNEVVRLRSGMELAHEGTFRTTHFHVTASPFTHRDRPYCLLILEDISVLLELEKIIPICANCKKIRRDKESWERVEEYLKRNFNLLASHGICPECIKTLYGDPLT